MPSPKDTGGPIVGPGPTRGQIRSRNQDGTWRKKRSDAGKPRVPKDWPQVQPAQQDQQDQQQGG